MQDQISEDFLQKNVAHWLDAKGLLWTASLAGLKLPPRTGRHKKILGCKPGVPDVMIFEPRGKFHGLFFELKSKDGVATPIQKEWQFRLNKRGYLSFIMPKGLEFPENFNYVQDVIEKYLLIT